MWKNLLNVKSKSHGCGPTDPRNFHYDQMGTRVSLERLQTYNTLGTLPTSNQNNNHERYNNNKAELTQLLSLSVFCQLFLNR